MEILRKQFSGRLGRKNWFLGVLVTQIVFVVAIGVVFMLLSFLTNLTMAGIGETVIRWLGGLTMLLFGIVGTVFILSLNIRRLHDLGKSAWWLLFFFVPFLNLVFLIYLLVWKGQEGANQYGDKPSEKEGILASVINRR